MRMSMEQTTHFGYSTVNLEEKAGLVQSLFSDVAVSYDLMNDVMSFGVHRIWKDALINWVKPQKGQAFLDLAGGTGDIAFRISKATSGKQKDITVCDLTPAMLLEGKKRAEKTIDLGQISWVAGDAMDLPFATNSFDVVTMAFGLRNVAVQDKAIEEIYRVLRPGAVSSASSFLKLFYLCWIKLTMHSPFE